MVKVLLFILAMSPLFATAKTITVCSTCTQTSIKGAVNQAVSGDTITIQKGNYQESEIQINIPLTLIGQGKPVIDGKGLGIIHVHADSVHIQGLKLINVGTSYTKDLAAIHYYRSNHFSIQDNELQNVFFGILLEKSHKGIVSNNLIQSKSADEYNSGNGIHLWHCAQVRIDNNEVTGMRDGIYFEFVSKSQVENNLSKHNVRYGLHFMFSNENEYSQNTFRDNGAGVAVMFSKQIKMHHNTFAKNWGTAAYGLLLKEIYDADITDNIFDENTIGINAEGSTRINYQHNTFERNGWAVKISGACYNNVFKRNNFIANAFDLSYQGSMNDNVFNHNYWSEYTGYDLDKNGIGDIPYRPVKLFSYVVNKTPEAIVLLRSLFVDIINFSEKVSPIFTPDDLIDEHPLMKMVK
ncbi:MAG TPA: nitrous oxide reductase family maturation protein NosD [Bacteroidetes bacterium]|nr:nitrous oxide reductase family maturation protein NosD [Bacteroidota bacterium]